MSLSSVAENTGGDRGGEAGSLTDTNLTRTFVAIATARTDSPDDILRAAIASGAVPQYGYPHPTFFIATCRSVRIQQRANSKIFDITADYDTTPVSKEEKDKEENPNPLDRPAVITPRTLIYEETTVFDRDGNARCNVAGDPFDPVPVKMVSRVYSVKKNVHDLPSWMFDYSEGGRAPINDAALTIRGRLHATNTLMLLDAHGEEQEENGQKFYSLSFELHYRPGGWKTKLLQAGYRHIDLAGSGDLVITAFDEDGALVDANHPKAIRPNTPVPLDMSAQPIIDGDNTSDFQTAEFDDYPEADFSILPLT